MTITTSLFDRFTTKVRLDASYSTTYKTVTIRFVSNHYGAVVYFPYKGICTLVPDNSITSRAICTVGNLEFVCHWADSTRFALNQEFEAGEPFTDIQYYQTYTTFLITGNNNENFFTDFENYIGFDVRPYLYDSDVAHNSHKYILDVVGTSAEGKCIVKYYDYNATNVYQFRNPRELKLMNIGDEYIPPAKKKDVLSTTFPKFTLYSGFITNEENYIFQYYKTEGKGEYTGTLTFSSRGNPKRKPKLNISRKVSKIGDAFNGDTTIWPVPYYGDGIIPAFQIVWINTDYTALTKTYEVQPIFTTCISDIDGTISPADIVYVGDKIGSYLKRDSENPIQGVENEYFCRNSYKSNNVSFPLTNRQYGETIYQWNGYIESGGVKHDIIPYMYAFSFNNMNTFYRLFKSRY